MKRLLSLLILLISTTAYADRPVLLIEESGYFLLRTVDGTPTLQPIAHVLDRRGTPDDPPTPDVPPVPPSNELTKQVREWAREVNDPKGAQALALVYHTIAEANLPVEAGIVALREASDVVLLSLGVQEKWEPFRVKASEALTTRRQKGLIQTPKDLSDFMIAVSQGIASAADGSEAIDFATTLSIVQSITLEIDKAAK